MKPGLVMMIDPRPGLAGRCVVRALDALGAADRPEVVVRKDTDWAVAAISPPGSLANCGADVFAQGGDILIWTGDVFLPSHWAREPAAGHPQRAIGLTLLRRLRAGGIEVLADVDGPFCGAWYDHVRDRWSVFNDRLGLLPVFWTASDDRLIVGPTAAVTWQMSGMPLVIDEDGVVDVIRAMNVTQDRTLIEGVHWLPGGHVLCWQGYPTSSDRCETRTYWEFRHLPPTARNKDEAMDAYVDAFKRTLRRQTAGGAPLMLGISGGIDSRMILAVCDRLGIVPACFTAGWPFSEDVRFGRRLARMAAASHEFVPFQTEALPEQLTRLIIETDGLHGARHLVNSLPFPGYLADHAGSVLLEGHIHGILGGGCVPADDDVAADRPPHESAWARKHGHAGGEIDRINDLLHPDLARRSFARWQAQIDDRYHRAPSSDPLERAEYASVNGRSGRNDVLGPGLCRHDVLVRSPATDRLMLDWCARTPGSWRRGKAFYMEVLRQRFPRFARVQRSDFNGLPMAQGRLLREYCWQREKIYRWWAGWRYPQKERWGTGGDWVTAWLWETWREAGNLRLIIEPNARVLKWVNRATLQKQWQMALQDPRAAKPLLTLGTIEVMVRWLESIHDDKRTDHGDGAERRLDVRSGNVLEPAAAATLAPQGDGDAWI